LVAGSIPA